MKTGPKSGAKSGYYLSLLNGKYGGKMPDTSSALRRKNPREHNRRVAIRTLYRRLHEAPKFKKFGKWVKSIRKQMKRTQGEFANIVGVSTITIKRWELGLGHLPADYPKKNKHGKKIPSNRERLNNLAALCEDMKKSGTDFEEE